MGEVVDEEGCGWLSTTRERRSEAGTEMRLGGAGRRAGGDFLWRYELMVMYQRAGESTGSVLRVPAGFGTGFRVTIGRVLVRALFFLV